jgi:hypothetical protein
LPSWHKWSWGGRIPSKTWDPRSKTPLDLVGPKAGCGFQTRSSQKKPGRRKPSGHEWSWGPGLNRRPAVYETAALPAELPQPETSSRGLYGGTRSEGERVPQRLPKNEGVEFTGGPWVRQPIRSPPSHIGPIRERNGQKKSPGPEGPGDRETLQRAAYFTDTWSMAKVTLSPFVFGWMLNCLIIVKSIGAPLTASGGW